MFGKSNANQRSTQIDSLIGVGTVIEGELVFSGGLRIDGTVKGNVRAVDGAVSSTLVLSEAGRIEGSVSVGYFVTNGFVVGPVTALEFLDMQSKARIVGDVVYASIEMHQGAVIEGRLEHRGERSVELKLAASA